MAKSKIILLVEDNADDVTLTLRVFKKYNMAKDIIVVQDGNEALDYLFGTGKYEKRDMNVVPAIVLLDLKLAKVGGLEVLKRLRADERTKLLPVVILTSSKEERDILKSYELGVNSYISKPVNFKKFAEAVRQLEQYWLILNESPPRSGKNGG